MWRRSQQNAAPRGTRDAVHIPGIGFLNRQQLRRLRDTIDGRATADVMDLPDLTNMNSFQLRMLEAALHRVPDVDEPPDVAEPPPLSLPPAFEGRQESIGTARASTHAGEVNSLSPVPSAVRPAGERRMPSGSPSPADSARGAGSTSSTSEAGHVSRLDVEEFEDAIAASMLGVAVRTPAAASSQDTTRNGKKWRVVDALFQTLTGKNVPADSDCAICFQPLRVGKLALPCAESGCASFFHSDCIRTWLERNPSCPLCRYDLEHLVHSIAPQPSAHEHSPLQGPLLIAALGRGDTIALQQPINRAYAFLLHHRERLPHSALAGGDALFTTIERLATQLPSPPRLGSVSPAAATPSSPARFVRGARALASRPTTASDSDSGADHSPARLSHRVVTNRPFSLRAEVAATRSRPVLETLPGDSLARMRRALQVASDTEALSPNVPRVRSNASRAPGAELGGASSHAGVAPTFAAPRAASLSQLARAHVSSSRLR